MAENNIAGCNWDACESCKNCPPDKGGCDIKAYDDINNFKVEFDDIICLRYSKRAVA